MTKLGKRPAIFTPREIPKEAKHDALTPVKSHPTDPNKGLLRALSRALTVHPHH